MKIIAIALLVLAARSLPAADFSFSDVFSRDDQTSVYQFAIAAPGNVGINTTSYATGGFSPVLSLFDPQNSDLLTARDNGIDHTSGEATLTLPLTQGSYVLAVTEYDNLARGPRLSDGFLRTGDPTFTRQFGTGGANGPFLNIDGQQRSGDFAFTISGVDSASSAPEPASVFLLAMAVIAAVFLPRIK